MPQMRTVVIRLYPNRAQEEGHELHYHVWKGMSHVFPVQPIKEAKQVFPQIMADLA